MYVVELNRYNWDLEVNRSPILTLVYFWHERCPWCREQTPIFEKLAADYEGKIKFARINVLESTENREIAMNLGVMGTPTLIFFCGGRPLMHLVGFASEQELRRVVNDMLGRHRSCLMQSTELKSYVV
ncbi:MAG: thioredoxin domain-containing protein [Candidatus Bathyarchaeia archaeon]